MEIFIFLGFFLRGASTVFAGTHDLFAFFGQLLALFGQLLAFSNSLFAYFKLHLRILYFKSYRKVTFKYARYVGLIWFLVGLVR